MMDWQVGTIVESAADFYSSRINKKDRKNHLVEEILEDSEKRRFLKRRFREIQQKKQHVQRFGKNSLSKKKK